MMVKIVILMIVPLLFSLAGCATSMKNNKGNNLKTLKIEKPYPTPNIIAMKDDMWVLVDPLSVKFYNKYHPEETYTVDVPEGFVMDLASIPIGFRVLAGKYHDLDTAAIVHDYLFWVQPCKEEKNGKRIADKLYRDTLKESGDVSWINAWVQWTLLKTASWMAWSNNKDAKNYGESRFMPEKYWSRAPKEKWSDLKGECCNNQVDQEQVLSNEKICLIKPKNS